MLGRFGLVLAGLLVVVGLGVPAGASAAEGGCPNEALRVELGAGALPECRAWEMVSAPFKGGAGSGYLLAVSSDGSRVLERAEEAGSYAGAQGTGGIVEVFYLSSRSGSGWATSSVEPPAAPFPEQFFFGASADLSRTLWGVGTPSDPYGAMDLYVREADGSFVEAGPMILASGPSEGYPYPYHTGATAVGSSRDASHVLFRLFTEGGVDYSLWPGDTTAKNRSLYEYVGTGNTRPLLVGVDSEGHLLGNCGVDAGSYRSQNTYNAISGDGETVFFTVHEELSGECSGPSVRELYARRGQFPIDTVPVSEPSYSDCTRCQTGVAGFGHPAVPLANAEFGGASEDGSKVFFTTEQELFAGDTGMNLYEYDFDNPAGQKIVRVSTGSGEPGVLGVGRVSEDGSHVYFEATGVLSGANAEGVSPTLGGANLYVFERDAAYPGGRVVFIGTTGGAGGDQATPDGRFFVFYSAADLTPGDTSSEPQVFEYDALMERLVRVSVGAAGYAPGQANADANFSFISSQSFAPGAARSAPLASLTQVAVSADGSRVVFMSPGALAAGAVEAAANGAYSVYEYHSTGSIANGDVSLISSGRDTRGEGGGAFSQGMTPSGDDVFFEGTTQLVAQDVDNEVDLYDARVGGGFPAPRVGGCVGEGCRGGVSSVSSFAGAGSVSGVGGGNLAPPPPSVPAGEAPAPKVKGRVLTRAQKLVVALRVCRRGPRRRRAVCEARARRRFGVSNGGEGR